VWQAPARAYGVIIGYDIMFFKADKKGSISKQIVVEKNRNQFFHQVKESDLPNGDSDTQIQVHE